MVKEIFSAKRIDKISKVIIYLMVSSIVLLLAFMVMYIILKGYPVISIEFLTSKSESFVEGGGIGFQLFNSIYLLVLTLIISIPLSMGAAIYLSEYAGKNRITNFVNLSIDVLSSLPSIVVGLFGFLVLVIELKIGFSVLSGAFTLTIFNLPILVRVIRQALENIDSSQREATLALGLTRWECVRHILIPSALPGIITGIILSSGRIFGEAASLIYTGGLNTPNLNFGASILSRSNPFNVFRPAETLAVHIWKVNSEGIIPDAQAISNGSAAVLIMVILVFNVLARLIGMRIYKNMTRSK